MEGFLTVDSSKNYNELDEMVVHICHHFSFRKNGWKWLSAKGLMILLGVSTPHEKSLVKAALERLEVKQKTCSYLGSLYGKATGIFYLMPPPAEWLQPLVEELKKQCYQQHCKRCGVVIPIDRSHHYCAACVALIKEEKKKTPKPKNCIICGQLFTPAFNNHKCCSPQCSAINKKQYYTNRSKKSDSQRD